MNNGLIDQTFEEIRFNKAIGRFNQNYVNGAYDLNKLLKSKIEARIKELEKDSKVFDSKGFPLINIEIKGRIAELKELLK